MGMQAAIDDLCHQVFGHLEQIFVGGFSEYGIGHENSGNQPKVWHSGLSETNGA